jgi:hypothetical protein
MVKLERPGATFLHLIVNGNTFVCKKLLRHTTEWQPVSFFAGPVPIYIGLVDYTLECNVKFKLYCVLELIDPHYIGETTRMIVKFRYPGCLYNELRYQHGHVSLLFEKAVPLGILKQYSSAF